MMACGRFGVLATRAEGNPAAGSRWP